MDWITSMLIRGLAKILPFIVRKFYTEEMLANNIRVQIRSDHEGLSIWGGDMPHFRGWVDILNLTPFTIEIDRLFGSFVFSHELSRFYNLEPFKLAPSQEKQIYINAELNSNQVAFIQRMLKIDNSVETKLEVKALVKTSAHNQIISKQVRTNNRRFVNFDGA